MSYRPRVALKGKRVARGQRLPVLSATQRSWGCDTERRARLAVRSQESGASVSQSARCYIRSAAEMYGLSVVMGFRLRCVWPRNLYLFARFN